MTTRLRDDSKERWVLVADADEGAARSLASRFHRSGFLAYPTTCAEEAMRLARVCRLALAVVDVSLWDMSGHDLVARLRAIDPTLFVIMTAADRSADSEIRARRTGIIHYAPKPVDFGQLVAVASETILGPARRTGSTTSRRSKQHE